MNPRALETLIRIDQVQSFSQAAALQNMTLSALSMQMKGLEQALGADLFDRSFRPPKLTPLGRQVAAQARAVVAAERQLTDLCAPKAPVAGIYRLGFIQSASVRILPQFLKAARHRLPKAHFDLSTGLSEDLTAQVRLGHLDGAVVTRVGRAETDLHLAKVATEAMAVAVPADQGGLPISALPRTLPFLHFRPSSGIGRLIADAMARQSTPPRETVVLDSLEAAVECVKAGLGYTVLPLPDILRCADRRVFVHPTGADALSREIVLAVRPDQSAARWVTAVADLLQSVPSRTAPQPPVASSKIPWPSRA